MKSYPVMWGLFHKPLYILYKDPYETTRMTHGTSPDRWSNPTIPKDRGFDVLRRCSTSRGKGGHPAWEATVWRWIPLPCHLGCASGFVQKIGSFGPMVAFLVIVWMFVLFFLDDIMVFSSLLVKGLQLLVVDRCLIGTLCVLVMMSKLIGVFSKIE